MRSNTNLNFKNLVACLLSAILLFGVLVTERPAEARGKALAFFKALGEDILYHATIVGIIMDPNGTLNELKSMGTMAKDMSIYGLVTNPSGALDKLKPSYFEGIALGMAKSVSDFSSPQASAQSTFNIGQDLANIALMGSGIGEAGLTEDAAATSVEMQGAIDADKIGGQVAKSESTAAKKPVFGPNDASGSAGSSGSSDLLSAKKYDQQVVLSGIDTQQYPREIQAILDSGASKGIPTKIVDMTHPLTVEDESALGQLTGKSRVMIYAHGSPGSASLVSDSGMEIKSDQYASLLKNKAPHINEGGTIKVSVRSCNGGSDCVIGAPDQLTQKGFGTNLSRDLDKQGIQAQISARTGGVTRQTANTPLREVVPSNKYGNLDYSASSRHAYGSKINIQTRGGLTQTSIVDYGSAGSATSEGAQRLADLRVTQQNELLQLEARQRETFNALKAQNASPAELLTALKKAKAERQALNLANSRQLVRLGSSQQAIDNLQASTNRLVRNIP
jgi:hypothetical protein